MAQLGCRLCHVHAKSARLGRLAKLETLPVGGVRGQGRYRHGTALSISTPTCHFHLLDPENWVNSSDQNISGPMLAGDKMCNPFVTKTTFWPVVPWCSSRDGPPESKIERNLHQEQRRTYLPC